MSDQEIVTSETPSDDHKMLAVIERAATDPNVNVDKMKAMLDMQERIMDKRAEAAFNQDLFALQNELPMINKNNQVEYPIDKKKPDGPKKKAFKFATYDVIAKAIKPSMDKFGFSVSFTTEMREGGGLIVTGTLLHRQGHSRDATIPVALDDSGGKNNIQGMGSSFSYGKRYTLTMLLNIITHDDDDGNSAEQVKIDDDQFAELQGLIDETGSDTAKFCEFFEVNSLSDIPTDRFHEAVYALRSKKEKARENT